MEAITTPKLRITFAVDLEVDYDPFVGRTPAQVAAALQDEIDDLLFEASSDVRTVYTSVTSIETDD